LKSNVSDHLEIVQAIYIDACAKCTADVSDLRDLMTIRSRVKEEGFSFLTITLPRFCSDFERSLATKHIDSTCFAGFRKHGSIPAFLQGMISQLFDHETGRIYDNTPIDATTIVESVRQICLAFKKIEVPCAPERVHKTIEGFAKIEQDFNEFSATQEDTDYFQSVAFMLWSGMLRHILPSMFIPRHGPGATAERVSGNQKYVWRYWHDRLEPYFPLIDTAYTMGAIDSEELKKVTIICQDNEPPVRVVCVPKTLKSPRIIAIEPCCMQYTQQAIQSILYRVIENSRMAGGRVNFRDQTVNQRLALMSSSDGRLATIDLSDASDRVPRDLALLMFQSNPLLMEAIDACRSTSAKLPDGRIISPLRKFASMGSALCFPVEAMYFYTICVMALLKEHDLPVTRRNVFRVSRDVHVYGDDIIVPAANAGTVLDYLRKYNCKVNSSKTFTTGNFRESCGVDAYLGEPVTPVYLRKLRPKNRQHASEIVSWVATANLFYLKGYWKTAQLMFSKCEQIIGHLPYVSPTSPALGRITFRGYRSIERWNSKLQRFEVKAWTPRPVYRTDELEGYGALQKFFLSSSRRDNSEASVSSDLLNRLLTQAKGVLQTSMAIDKEHLERSALHGAVVLQRRWVPAS
jgi:hypothetical protein